MAKKAAAKKPKKPEPIRSLKDIPADNEAQAQLQDRLKEFDNIGVSIVEEQWRKLPEAGQNMAISWLKSRLAKQASPLPPCLFPFATQALKDESKAYADEQEKLRKILFPVEFGKPSPTKPTSDEGEEQIKMTCIIPIASMSGTRAEETFGFKRLKIEFSLRPMSEWSQKQILEGHHRIISTVADVSGFTRTRHNRKFSFLIDQSSLGLEEAFGEFWKASGSCRVEVLGPIVKDEEKPKPPVAAGQQRLPNSKPETKPDQTEKTYTLARINEFEVTATVHKGKEGWLCDIDGVTPRGGGTAENTNYDLGRKKFQPRASASEAMSARIGQVIDFWEKNYGSDKKAAPLIVRMKGWLTNLIGGKQPDEIRAILDAKK